MNYNKKNKGFSLLELILAITFFSLGSYAIATLLIDSNISTKLSIERTEALLYVKEGVEATKSIRNNNWSDLTDGNHGLDGSGGSWVFSSSSDYINDKYTRVVGVTSIATSTKQVLVTVEWNLTPTRKSSVILETILTQWK